MSKDDYLFVSPEEYKEIAKAHVLKLFDEAELFEVRHQVESEPVPREDDFGGGIKHFRHTGKTVITLTFLNRGEKSGG